MIRTHMIRTQARRSGVGARRRPDSLFKHAATAIVAVLAGVPAASAAILYVAPCGQDAWTGLDVNCFLPHGPKRTIQAAIDQAVDGDEIRVFPGIYQETIDLDGKAVHLLGLGGADGTVIDANFAGTAIRCESSEGPSTHIEGFSIIHGRADGTGGGGMRCVWSSPSITRCTFHTNQADRDGGGLYVAFGSPGLVDCSFVQNTADERGGGMFVIGGSPGISLSSFDENTADLGGGMAVAGAAAPALTSTSFTGNVATGPRADGGGMYVVSSAPDLGLVVFDGNRAGAGGGLFADVNCDLDLTWCAFRDNESTPHGGGGALVVQSSIACSGCSFEGNVTSASGGGLAVAGGTADLPNAVFNANAAQFGGGLDLFATTATLPDPSFTENEATVSGGAIAVREQSAATIVDGDLDDNVAGTDGGGLFVDEASATIDTCTFERNIANIRGGGVRAQDGSTLVVDDSIFNANRGGSTFGIGSGGGGGLFLTESTADVRYTILTGNVGGFGGGAMLIHESTATIDNATMNNNTGKTHGGAIITDGTSTRATITRTTFFGNRTTAEDGRGGAIAHGRGTLEVSRASFVSNTVPDEGGALYAAGNGHATVVNANFRSNTAGRGGAVLVENGAALTLANTILHLNEATLGGAIFAGDDGTRLANCTVVDNVAPVGSAIVSEGTLRVANSIIWGHAGSRITGTGTTLIAYSAVEGGWPGAGNIDLDPQFVDPMFGNYRLDAASPCIDAGTNQAVPADTPDLDADGMTVERLPYDFGDDPRFADAASGDAGCGPGAIVDMGAFEVAGAAAGDVLVGDVNDDGVVDFADLLPLLAAWGPCPGCCPADLNVDGVVDFEDVLVVLSHWTS